MRRCLSPLPGLALIAALALGLGAYALCRSAYTPLTGAAYAARALELRLPGAQVLEDEDTHGGFHGDGARRIVLAFDAGIMLYGDETHGGLAEDQAIPRLETGWWYYLDRQTGKTARALDGVNLTQRGSTNMTAAVYDAETDTLYYLDYDT